MLGYITYGLIAVSCISVISSILVNISSPNGLWVMLGAYRMMMFVPFIGATLSSDMMDYLSRLSFVLFSFSFVPTNKVYGLSEIFNLFNAPQPNENLSKLKLKYSSAFINHLNLLLILIVIMSFHMLFALIYYVWKWK